MRQTALMFMVLTIFGLSFTRTAHAYRPFAGTDGDVAELGEFELELGPVHLYREAGRNYLLGPVTVLNLGIIPRVELVVDFVGTAPLRAEMGESHYQVRDTDVFLKVLLRKGVLQEESGPSIALEAGPLLPEINGQNGYGAAANLIVSERWGWFLVHLNNEIELSRGHGLPIWSNSLITEFRVSDTIWPVAELLWEREIRSGASSYSALAGFIWSVSDGLDLDMAGVVASVEGERAYEARLGFTWAFQIWEPPNSRGAEDENNAHE
jgi:hypothetical protein